MKFLDKTGNSKFASFNEENTFYVDKTLFIKDFIDNIEKVNIITRPRRFGKSLNLDMLDEFLNINKNSYDLFKDKLISKHEDYLKKHLNKYPVIRLKLNKVNGTNFENFLVCLKYYIAEIYGLIKPQLKNVSESDLETFNLIYNRKSDETLIVKSLEFLTKLLYESYNKKVIILIDEYDYLFEEGYIFNYYEDMKNILGPLLLNALKENDYLYGSLLVGVKQVAQASLFSKLNNADDYTIEKKTFAPYFGFTEDEVKDSLEKFGLSSEFENVKKWYDGYNIGGITIYNPWSIYNYLHKQELISYWVNTGGTGIIENILKNLPENEYNGLKEAIEKDNPIDAKYNNRITYNQKLNYNEAISLLYDAGYLKKDGVFFRVVNYEVKREFESMFATIFSEDQSIPEYYRNCLSDLGMLKLEKVKEYFQEAVLSIKSSDHESYLYHILDMMSNSIKDKFITSREDSSPNGKSDFIMRDIIFDSAFIIEAKKSNGKSLKYMFNDAFKQIEEKNYDSQLRALNYKKIFKVVIVVKDGKVDIKITSDNMENLSNVQEEFIYKK